MRPAANSNGHARWHGDAAAYALNALEDGELRGFEQHLEACAPCQEELAAMRGAVESLPAAVPTLAAPSELKERVMAEVRAEAARAAFDRATVRLERARRNRPLVSPPAWLRPSRVAGAVVALAVVVVVGALTFSGGRSARTYAGIVYAPGATASVRESGGSARLTFSRLPAPPAARVYEVWLKRKAKAPEPTQALFATRTGSITVPGDLTGVQALLVTAEPRPRGSLAPTRTPIIVVRLV